MTWEWNSDSAAVVDRVAAILDPRLSTSTVSGYVELLYVSATSSLSEQAAYAKRRASNPYRAKTDFNGHVRCGAHAWLHAQLVRDLVVRRQDETGIETLEWHTLPTYQPSDGLREKISDGMKETVTRRIVGPVSFGTAWDRLAGRFKNGFEPPSA